MMYIIERTTLSSTPDSNAVDQNCLLVYVGFIIIFTQKRVSYLYRTAQPSTLAAFRPWGSSTGAGRIRLTRCKNTIFFNTHKFFFEKIISRVFQRIMVISCVFPIVSTTINLIFTRFGIVGKDNIF